MNLTTFKCSICNKPKGRPYDHSQCARMLQKTHAMDKRDKRISSTVQLERLGLMADKN